MSNKKDLRVVKTERVLYESLLALLKEKTIEEITISDLCHKAFINRSTFYAHYNDKDELVKVFLNSLKRELSQSIEDNYKKFNTKEYYLEMLKLLLNHIEERKEVYQSIAIKNNNGLVMDILLDVINKDIEKHLEKNKPKGKNIASKVVSTFYTGAVTCLCMEWLKNPIKYTKESLIDFLSILIPDKCELDNINAKLNMVV